MSGSSPLLQIADVLPLAALDERVAIVGTSGAGKTYAAKSWVERLLEAGVRVCVVDPPGVWWGLRASADGTAPGYPVIVFGGRHADVPLTAEMGGALGRLIASHALACVVDVSELGSGELRHPQLVRTPVHEPPGSTSAFVRRRRASAGLTDRTGASPVAPI
jgi:hypothetical protein